LSRIDITRRALLTSGSAAALGQLAGCSSFVADLVRNPVYDTSAVDATSSAAQPADPPAFGSAPPLPSLFDDIERRTFDFFWATGNPANGLVPDRHPTSAPASIAAVGFALTAYAIGADRGYITRAQARERTLATVRFFRNAPQGPQPRGKTGHRGFFYHFIDMKTGARAWHSEISTVDTALLLAGMLHAQAYFTSDHPDELEIRQAVDAIYWRIDWKWAQVRGALISMGWSPEKGHIPYDWAGYNEAMLVVLLALGSPTHPVGESAWSAWSESYRGAWAASWATSTSASHRSSDTSTRTSGSTSAASATRRCASAASTTSRTRAGGLRAARLCDRQPEGFYEYGANVWGFTACDGPGKLREFDRTTDSAITSTTRRAAPVARERSTTARSRPTAALSSLPFAPEIVIPAIEEMHERYGKFIYSKFGFVDSFNRSLTATDVKLSDGRVDPAFGWIANDCIGIDQGPILAMIGNYRNALVWDDMRNCVPLRRGLERAGFEGGWLASAS
jgi:hypothetical protein